MKIKMLLISLTILIGQLAYADDLKDCEYELYVPSISVDLTESNQVIPWDATLSRDKDNGGPCNQYWIFFGKGSANSYQRKAFTLPSISVNYNLHKLANLSGTLKDFGDASTSAEFIQGSAPNKKTPYNARFYVSVPSLSAQNFPRGGYYYDNIQASIYSKNNKGQWIFEDAVSFIVLLVVPKKIEVSLIDEGDNFDPSSTTKTLDFGHITQFEEMGADLRVVSNTPYKVMMSSSNNGELRLNASSSISYALKVNGTSISLGSSSGTPVTIGTGNETNTSGDRYNLRVQITESTNNKQAGQYQDFITINAIAN